MKSLVTVALLTLMCSLCHTFAAPVGLQFAISDGCCPELNRTAIPRGFVKYMVKTPINCESAAIVITTVCEQKYCIDAKWTWAQTRLAEFEQSSGAPFNTEKCVKESG